MAVTLTSRFGLPQWSAGADTPSRTAFNDAFAKIDAQAAKDAGAVGGTALPTAGLADGMYAQTTDGNYRRFYRRAGGAWQQIGGNTWSEPTYLRADSGLGTGTAARVVSHPSLATAGLTENWDGSSARGGRQAIADLNSGQPGALHVGGDPTTAVDLAARGRVYVRTTADGHRGIVAQAHGTGAGPLFAARESGGTDPWLVDALGRMRAQAPAAFGAAALATGVPLVSAPGGSDTTAADLYAAASKSALRILRAVGDGAPIADFQQDRIILGRSSWAGARIDLIAPQVAVSGPLSVSGQTSLAGLSAGATSVSSLSATAGLSGASASLTGSLSAEGGLVQSSGSGGGAVLTRPSVQYSGSNYASLRQSHVGYTYRVPKLSIGAGATGQNYDLPVYMPESGWMRLDSVIRVQADLGASNAIEPMRVNMTFSLLDTSGNVIEKGFTHVNSTPTDDTSRQIEGWFSFTITDLFWTRVSSGNYVIRLNYTRGSVLGGWIDTVRYIVTPVVLANVNSS